MHFNPYHEDFKEMGFKEPEIEKESYKHSKGVLIDVMKAIKNDLDAGDEAKFKLALEKLTLTEDDLDQSNCQLI
jgi:hypothetical protein